jgi:hypothetical protein
MVVEQASWCVGRHSCCFRSEGRFGQSSSFAANKCLEPTGDAV